MSIKFCACPIIFPNPFCKYDSKPGPNLFSFFEKPNNRIFIIFTKTPYIKIFAHNTPKHGSAADHKFIIIKVYDVFIISISKISNNLIIFAIVTNLHNKNIASTMALPIIGICTRHTKNGGNTSIIKLKIMVNTL